MNATTVTVSKRNYTSALLKSFNWVFASSVLFVTGKLIVLEVVAVHTYTHLI